MHLLTHLCALSALLGMLVGCAGAARVVQDATPTTVLSAVMPIDAPPSPLLRVGFCLCHCRAGQR